MPINLRLIACFTCILIFNPTITTATNLDGPDQKTDEYYDSAFDWTGLYFGASAGYGWGSSAQTYNRANNHGLAKTSPRGAMGALSAGYNHQFWGGFVLGAEADLGIMDVSADDKIVYDGHNYKTSFGPWWGSIRARAGFGWDRTLLFLTGGAAWMGVDETSLGDAPGQSAFNKDVRSGWVVGGGIEHAFTDKISAKIEYLHFDFGTYNGFSANREDFSFENKLDLVRVGLNYKY